MKKSEISIQEAKNALQESGALFTELFKYGSLVVEFYKPEHKDLQTPHNRDEIYVIAAGEGVFDSNGRRWNFKAGDFLFVPAGAEHRFEHFTDNFCTWVFFYGPEGGEKPDGQKER